ncbi:MAG: J domain-containing protein [Granulosicoccus sp.]
MTTHDTQKTQFALHYEQLQLSDRANWDIARSSYRRLVHVWHPDKFASRPREQVHAQQQFINLTKSYNALRDFYRKNQRLPFQSVHAASTPKATRQPDSRPEAPESSNAPMPDSNVLSRDPAPRNQRRNIPRKARNVAWVLLGVITMLSTIMFFLIVDRNANRATAEIGREVVKEAPQSNFMPTAAEIRKSQTRGVFVKPTQ